ncbi:MAG: hypothetical protein J0H53_10960 [Rhizobiales bacterium]|nr:hypothetical protein [Hyphomicrobiales bacterium]
MTIAACYISPEGVVFGADSTSTYGVHSDRHYYNNAQKIFEVGEDTTLGIVTWGLGGLSVGSYRMLIALFADDLAANPPASLLDVATRWSASFWAAYSASDIWPHVLECRRVNALTPHDPAVAPNAGMRTKDEEENIAFTRSALVAGFCIGGYLMPDRTPGAYVVLADPLDIQPVPVALTQGWSFWGAPNLIQRLLFGCDDSLKASIITSGHWHGTPADLEAIVADHQLAHPLVPMREAIDFVHSCIYSTIKAMKFSSLPQICGGPIELAAITADRKFRWVRHKAWDAAILEGGTK